MWVCNNVHKHQDFDSSYDNQTINTMTCDYLKQTLIIMIILTDDNCYTAMLCSNCQSSVEWHKFCSCKKNLCYYTTDICITSVKNWTWIHATYIPVHIQTFTSAISGYLTAISFFMAALCNRGGALYFCPVVSIFLLLSYSIFFSSPNLSRRRFDVYHTSTHGVALGLVQI